MAFLPLIVAVPPMNGGTGPLIQSSQDPKLWLRMCRPEFRIVSWIERPNDAAVHIFLSSSLQGLDSRQFNLGFR